MKLNYIPVLNILLITDSLGLHKICILKKSCSNEALFAFWVKIIMKFKGMKIKLDCTEIEIYTLIHTIPIVTQC